MPFDQDNRKELIELADSLDRHEPLTKLFAESEERASIAGDHVLARDLAWELGQLFDTYLHQSSDAERPTFACWSAR